jgi:16S rRNA (cytidine1402-2'-O)-methyltransferase
MKEKAFLFLVPTPIGNLEDITLRAIRILKEVDLILAEDTRVTRKLLNHYDINTPLKSYHAHNEHRIKETIITQLKQGFKIALVTDAGTPGISDPGFLIVRTCIENNIEVECLPGPTAFVPALVKSGIPSDRFTFEGFLPHKKGRKKKLEILSVEPRSMVFYESPHRLIKTLHDLAHYFGEDRLASVSRELTKKFEETINDNLNSIILYFEKSSIKGEFVIVVQGKTNN